MAKLWEKGYKLEALIEEFTVGNDVLLDRALIASDAVASMAHARMLASIGLLTQEEALSLHGELARIIADAPEGRFSIEPSDEDVHTAIERRLTERLGDAGKKIHAGRSRNDQVATALRVYTRDRLFAVQAALISLVETLTALAEREAQTPMTGRTHLQPAMLSSVGLWAAAYAELLADDAALILTAERLNDRSPLGSAASYGVPLPLDRTLVARLLGFREPHHNVLAANNARGKVEAIVLDALDQLGLTLSRFAQDVILFSLPEIGYFRLPMELCSGSSIMPQKRNPDGMELMRGKSATLSSYSFRAKQAIRNLPSGYNRDIQETKEPLLDGLALARRMVAVSELTVERLEVDRERCLAGITAEVFATDDAIDRVRAGASFRDAYREVAEELMLRHGAHPDSGRRDPVAALRERSSLGAPGNLDLAYLQSWVDRAYAGLEERRSHVDAALKELVGAEVRL